MKNKCILITGGAGFIGSHVVRNFVTNYPKTQIVNLDLLTYAGNLENLRDIENAANYRFEKGDIADEEFVSLLLKKYPIDGIIHLAAESHVDRSITNPMEFIRTNILGSVVLLNHAKQAWQGNFEGKLFYHVSTDEVYGSLGNSGLFTEETAYDPKSPYSASKASSDHLVRAYYNTYGLPIVISNCSNNYGPNQFPEKLLPLAINNIKNMKSIPIYGKGDNIRDWLYVKDHAIAIERIFNKGKVGETYNIGGNNEWTNLDLIHLLCKVMDKKLKREPGTSASLITFVTDRAGHDKRYAIDSSKIKETLNWEPSLQFEEGLELTVDWYLNNEKWMQDILSGAYQEYYKTMYDNR